MEKLRQRSYSTSILRWHCNGKIGHAYVASSCIVRRMNMVDHRVEVEAVLDEIDVGSHAVSHQVAVSVVAPVKVIAAFFCCTPTLRLSSFSCLLLTLAAAPLPREGISSFQQHELRVEAKIAERNSASAFTSFAFAHLLSAAGSSR